MLLLLLCFRAIKLLDLALLHNPVSAWCIQKVAFPNA
jgi:hypothetical protein